MFEDLTSLVVDIGTRHTRIGYGGDDAPKLMPYSYVTSNSSSMETEDLPNFLVGDKYLYLDRSENEIHSIFDHSGADGYAFNFDKL
jgi:actin-related protein